MDRRALLSGLAGTTLLDATGGCLGGGGGPGDDDGDADEPADGDDEPTDTTSTDGPGGDDTDAETGTSAPASGISNRRFERTGDCPVERAGTAEVTFGADAVTATGCITGNNGCKRAALAGTTYDDASDTLTIVVTTTTGEETPAACTQQLVRRAYEATVSFAGDLPDRVSVVHESMGERTEAATASRA
ncbi:hypothetical protein [Halorarum halobium]|uniref:hypothetical protein n=1 Tax=Halorarum halobium TaxID=3075121 RepID=UPI0028B23582|nr:hypothetical protein [Halobaculum sp. XH14]